MIKVLTKLFLFLLPFLLLSFTIFIVDPYNFINVSHVVADETKVKCLNRTDATIPRGNILWKTIEFRRTPAQNIVLGDSKVAYISNSSLATKIGGETYNLAFPGCNFRSIIDQFWMAADKIKLKNVIIQPDVYNYNFATNGLNLFAQSQQVIENPFSYFLGWNYVKDSFATLYYLASKDEHFISRGFQRTGDNWKKSLKGLESHYQLSTYIYPTEIYNGLKKISDYCNENDINLFFVLTPDYYEVNEVLHKPENINYYTRFKSDLAGLGILVDLTNDLPFSHNKNFYADHFHVKMEYSDTLVSVIFNSEAFDRISGH